MNVYLQMKNHHWLITLLIVICHLSGLICEEVDYLEVDDDTPKTQQYASSVLDHPDKLNYQSQQLGSEKHHYGYELKSSGKHFHHTSTEKDGVRLGCFGYELEGKMYITQYVADARGYRLVTNEDLITVYPKTPSGAEGKAGFFPSFLGDQPRNVRYFFPKGCKGIDVQIDNSSRLRSLKFDNNAKLPVTLKPEHPPNSNSYYTRPPQSYPGPSNIYAPTMVPIQTARPPTSFGGPSNVYLPPPLNNTYLPPKPDNTYLPPLPNNTYLPPEEPEDYDNSIDITNFPPENVHQPEPITNQNNNNNQQQPSNKPPSHGGYNQVTGLTPPKEPNCPGTVQYCDSSNGCLIIPIELKNKSPESCCSNVAKLILPLKQFNEEMVQKISEAIPREMDANDLIHRILDNILL